MKIKFDQKDVSNGAIIILLARTVKFVYIWPDVRYMVPAFHMLGSI